MKLVAVLGTFLVLIVSALFVIAFSPYHIYHTALSEGINSEFIVMKAPKKGFVDPAALNLNKEVTLYEDPKLWSDFHFSNYVIPLPIHHPAFMVVPLVEGRREQDIEFGAVFLGLDNKEYVRFKTDQAPSLKVDLEEQKIFELPIFKTLILSKTTRELWQDLFQLKISLPEKKESTLGFLQELWAIPYNQLVYNLFILQMRHQLFPENAVSFSFYPEKDIALFEIHEVGVNDTALLSQGLDPEFRNEIVMMFEKGQLYQFRLRTLYENPTAQYYRYQFLETLEYKLSTHASAVPIYASYKNLDYSKRVDQAGMVHLFSAWTHIPKREEYLIEMIHFLERGRSEYRQLAPLYEYAYRSYGSTFSSRASNLRETADQRMKRILRETAAQERVKASTREISSEGLKLKGEEKLKFILERAKESGVKEEEEDWILVE